MTERVNIKIDQGVAQVQLARPDKLNGLDRAMLEAMVKAGERLANEPGLRCVVLSGQGPAFCAGLDFASFMSAGMDQDAIEQLMAPYPDSPANFAQQVAYVWKTLPVPVIAAVHGHCYGGGLQLALAADIRLLCPEAKLSVMEIKWGLVPDMTGTQTLRHLVGLDVAKELTFTGRVVSGTEAVRLGLGTRAVEQPIEAASELARTIAGKSPHAIRAAKRLFDGSVECTLVEGLELEADTQRPLLGSPNQLEAVMANIQKRTPEFQEP